MTTNAHQPQTDAAAHSGRQARAQRRAAERARQRELRERLHIDGAGEHGDHRAACLVAGCEREGPVVVFGIVHLALCERHKAEYDARYAGLTRRRRSSAA